MSKELWLPIPGYEGRYEVSDMGRVRSYANRWGRTPSPHVLSAKLTHKGYERLQIRSNGTERNVGVHCLVLLAFVGPRPAGYHAAHLNGNPGDNRLVNLAYVTPQINYAHSVQHGTATIGSRHGGAKLHERDIPAIRARISTGESHKVIARAFGVSDSMIDYIALGRYWKHVPTQEPAP